MFVYLEGTILSPCTLGKLFWFIFTDIVAFTLTFMTTFAEMSRAPAEPLSYVATESALIIHKLRAVRFTTLVATLNIYTCAFTTNQLFWLEYLLFLLSSDAILFPSEIAIFAFEALVIGQFKHCPFL